MNTYIKYSFVIFTMLCLNCYGQADIKNLNQENQITIQKLRLQKTNYLKFMTETVYYLLKIETLQDAVVIANGSFRFSIEKKKDAFELKPLEFVTKTKDGQQKQDIKPCLFIFDKQGARLLGENPKKISFIFNFVNAILRVSFAEKDKKIIKNGVLVNAYNSSPMLNFSKLFVFKSIAKEITLGIVKEKNNAGQVNKHILPASGTIITDVKTGWTIEAKINQSYKLGKKLYAYNIKLSRKKNKNR